MKDVRVDWQRLMPPEGFLGQRARASIFEFVESFYNRVRRHSSLGYLSPSAYEQATMEEAAVA